jgi:predicted RNase H-like HicB family nuclease
MLPNGWLTVSSPQLPGLVTQAQSQSELVEMVNDAVLTYYGVPKREADIVYDKFNLGDQVIQYQAKLQTQAA